MFAPASHITVWPCAGVACRDEPVHAAVLDERRPAQDGRVRLAQGIRRRVATADHLRRMDEVETVTRRTGGLDLRRDLRLVPDEGHFDSGIARDGVDRSSNGLARCAIPAHGVESDACIGHD
jgi:hypothetical protein